MATNTADSSTEHTGNGSTTSFSISFTYLSTAEIDVKVNNVVKSIGSDYTISGQTLTFSSAPSNGHVISIKRDTNIGQKKVDFEDGSVLTETDLDNNTNQLLFGIQEIADDYVKRDGSQTITGDIVFEGSVDDANETTLSVTNPTADRTITVPDVTGTIVTTGDTGTVTSTMINNGTIVNADINSSANIAGTKLADDSVTLAKLGSGALPTDITVASANIVDGTIVNGDIANTTITGGKLANDTITSTQIGANAVTASELADDAVDTNAIQDGGVTRAKIAADAIDGTKIENDAIANEHIADLAVGNAQLGNTSVGTTKLQSGAVTNNKIADNSVNADKLATAAVTTVKIQNGAVIGSKLAQNSVGNNALNTNAVATENIQGNAVTFGKIANEAIVTSSEQASHSVNNSTFFTTAAAEARYFNASTGETIKDGQTFPDNDTTIATTAAINDRIIDLVDEVGGFVPIANETSFPTTNPDVNNGTGTIVSVATASTNLTPSGTTVTIANGAGSGNTVTITGVPSVISSGFGFLVETTTTLHTYTFHRLVPKATEVTTVATNATQVQTVHNNINNINAVANNATNINAVAADASDIGAVAGKATEIGRLGTADAVADMALLGTTDVVADMNLLATSDVISDMNTLAVADVISDMNTLAVSDVISDMNDLATSGNITAMSTCSTNISSITNASNNISSVNNFGDKYQVASSDPTTDGGGNALAAGDLYFNTSANELKVYTGSQWQGGVTATGNFATVTGNTFTGDNLYNDNVKAKFGTGSDLQIYHNGSSNVNYIQATSGSTIFQQQGNGSSIKINATFIHLKNHNNNATYLKGSNLGAVELYYDNSKKFETTSDGVKVTGTDGTLLLNATRGTGNEWQWSTSGSNANAIELRDVTANLRAYIYHNNTGLGGSYHKWYTHGTLQFEVLGSHVNIVNDNSRLKLGTGQDLQIWHSGSHSYLQNTTGNLFIHSNELTLRSASQEMFIDCSLNDSVDLYYDNSKKLETTSSGVKLLGGTTVVEHTGGNSNFEVNKVSGASFRIQSQTSAVRLDTIGASHTMMLGTNGNGRLLISDSNIDLLNDNQRLRIGAGQDLELYHNGLNTYIKNNTGDTHIVGAATNSVSKWMYIQAQSGEHSIICKDNAAVELYYDASKKFETTSTGVQVFGNFAVSNTSVFSSGVTFTGANYNIAWVRSGDMLKFNDEAKLVLGTHEDIIVKHDSANNINFWTNRAGKTFKMLHDTENQIVANHNGSIELYHDGTKRFETNGVGIKVSNDILVGNGTDLEIKNDSASETLAKFRNNNAVELYYDNSKKLETTSSGVSVTGGVTATGFNLSDNQNIQFGASNDLKIFHNGSHSYIADVGTGDLRITGSAIHLQNAAQSENMIRTFQDGAVELYYDNSKKFETLVGGARWYGVIKNPTDGVDQGIYFGVDNDLQISHDGSNNHIKGTGNHFLRLWTNNTIRWNIANDGHFRPEANNAYDIGSSNQRVRNIYTNDLNLSNEGSANDVDGTWGSYTIQEGAEDLFLINRRNGKKYKFALTEVS